MHTLEQLRAGKLKGIRRLTLCCGLTEFPREIFSLADSLEILDLSGNHLSSLPDDLARLSRLKIIFCSQNQFTQLPAVLGQCPSLSMVGFKSNQIEDVPAESLPSQLRWLILTDNRVKSLPDNIGDCAALQKLMLAGNQLSELPVSLANCQALELIRIAANRLAVFPDWLLSLPRLTWLAYAGNPFSHQLEQQALRAEQRKIDWHQLDIAELLGEGASGLIYRATLRQNDYLQPVAVKLFKGAMTSDGLPLCEMAATMKTGRHTGLTQTVGQIQNHPDGVDGLVMALIPNEFGNLAGPPSLESCTRDVYPAELRCSQSVLLRIAAQIAGAACHLHQQGVMHGDLYAHNILWTNTGDALLSDFGAASFFDPAELHRSEQFQRLEVRAFGCLLEELTARCDDLSVSVQEALQQLIAACLQPQMAYRPSFADICGRLQQITQAS